MDSSPGHSPFPVTRWTLVLRVRAEGDRTAAHRALADLCAAYWYPLYAFARRRGHGPQDAEDLTQGFFAAAIESNLFAKAEPQLGKLRTFLLTAFRHHLADLDDRARAQKRGGGGELIPLDFGSGEDRYSREPADPMTPEKLFERSWAVSVVRIALAALADDETRAGRGAQFRALEPFLSPDTAAEPSYTAAAGTLGLSEDAAWQAVSRLRKKFRLFLRRQIADTLHAPSDAQIEAELDSLRAALCV